MPAETHVERTPLGPDEILPPLGAGGMRRSTGGLAGSTLEAVI